MSEALITTLDSVDVWNPDIYQRGGAPHATFKRLRAEAPVYRHREPGGRGFWAVTKYKDVWDVSLHPQIFCSSRGTNIEDHPEQDVVDEQAIMLNMDPPRHTKYRRLVNLGFSPKMVNRMESHTREIAARIVDGVARRGACDFVTEIAAELPLQVIVEMLGVPLADRKKVFEWSNTMIGFDDPEYAGGDREVGKMTAMQMFMYAHQLAEQRRGARRDDLISALLDAEVEGEQLSEMDFNAFFLLLAIAGNETTRNLVSGAMLALFENPEQWERLRAEPALVPTAVEEFVRWVTPVMYFRRTALQDAEIRGQHIPKGDKVVIYYVSANRDEEVFPDGDRFDVGRTPNEHLGFGIGPHFCLGANLARLEIRIMFEEILRRLPDIRPAGPVERLRSNFIHGIKRMPVRFTPERG